MSVLLGIAWAALVLLGARRVLVPRARDPRGPRAVAHGSGAGPLVAVGAVARRATAFGSPEHDRTRGALVLVTAALAVVAPPLAVLPPLTGAGLAALSPRRRAARAETELWAELPEAAELLAVAVSAGCNQLGAVRAVADRLSGPVAAGFRDAVGRVEAGARLDDALGDACRSLGDPAAPLLDALRASERYGTPLLPGLRRCSDELRAARRRRAEEAARRVPVRLLLPLCGCILPAFVLLTFVPLLAGSVTSLDVSP